MGAAFTDQHRFGDLLRGILDLEIHPEDAMRQVTHSFFASFARNFFFSFPNSIWERTCPGNSIAATLRAQQA